MEKVVFTNGCFDVLHPGHVDLLNRAKELGTKLVVGINSDRSVRTIKGPGRPLNDQESRKSVLLGLRAVDEVVIFDELTPDRLIKDLKPSVLVKGGDWNTNEIIGADTVLASGGEVHSLPLLEGHSTTATLSRMLDPKSRAPEVGDSVIGRSISQHIETIAAVEHSLEPSIAECASLLIETVRKGNKVLICGNGGSAADAQHIAAEFVGRYESERQALPAIALTTDTSALTALANDYNFDRIFARQVEALAREGDCLIAISTSGNSPNIIAAVMAARQRGCKILGMTGANGKKLAALSDACVMIPSERTARIQEAHILIAHIWCELVDEAFQLNL